MWEVNMMRLAIFARHSKNSTLELISSLAKIRQIEKLNQRRSTLF